MTCSPSTVADLIRALQGGDDSAADRLCRCYASELTRGARRADPHAMQTMREALCNDLVAAVIGVPVLDN